MPFDYYPIISTYSTAFAVIAAVLLDAKEAIKWQAHLAAQGIWVRRFSETPALRFGLPPDDSWDKLENALKTL